MALTRQFRETIQERIQRDPKFRNALLQEAIECLLTDDIQTGKAIFRDFINGTIGFESLAEQTEISSKSLMRMFSPSGNPTATNLFHVIANLQDAEGISLKVKVSKAA